MVDQSFAFLLVFLFSGIVTTVALKSVVEWIDKFGTERFGYQYAAVTVLVGLIVTTVLSFFSLGLVGTFFWIWWIKRRYSTELVSAIGIAIAVNVIVYASFFAVGLLLA